MNKQAVILAICALTASVAPAQSVYPGQHRGKLAIETTAPVKAECFNLRDVRLLPGRVRENLERDSAWMSGIEVTYPMSLTVETTPDNPLRGAGLYGPIVLAGLRGTEGMATPCKSIKRTGGPGLTFTTADNDILKPLYDIHRCRYVVYWDIIPAETRTDDYH